MFCCSAGQARISSKTNGTGNRGSQYSGATIPFRMKAKNNDIYDSESCADLYASVLIVVTSPTLHLFYMSPRKHKVLNLMTM